ncbi:MAG: hypothetical protein OXT65_00025 [Alphaproteobacteria bacterium]|nr:hypothetical protein [Alphaproteobacteria bacterium]
MKCKVLTVAFMIAVFLGGCKEAAMAVENPIGYMAEANMRKKIFGSKDMPDRCKGRQWKDPKEHLDCKYPPPPAGRWKAVYAKDFAEKHSLPLENISTDLSPGVDYMEMETMPFGKDWASTACMVNMLVKKPHDVALYNTNYRVMPLPEKRKLLHLLDLEKHRNALKATIAIQAASRDYVSDKRGYRKSTFAMYAEDVLPGYDYISADMGCRHISLHPQYFPGGFAFWMNKASVWGRYEMQHRNAFAPDTPKGKDFDRSHFFINVPHELISTVFDGVPIGGK